MTLTFSTTVQASQCLQYLAPTSAKTVTSLELFEQNPIFSSYFTNKRASKFIGLAVKDNHGQEHVVLGPIVGSGHRRLLQKLEDTNFEAQREIVEILWAGEIHLLATPQKLTVLEVNEVAGLNQQIQAGYLPQFKNSSSVKNIVEILQSKPAFEINARTQVKTFETDASHILEYVSAKDFRHELGNRFNVMSIVEFILMGRHFENLFGEKEIESLVESTQVIKEFSEVFLKEVGPRLSREASEDVQRLFNIAEEMKAVKTETELKNFVTERPLFFQSLQTIYSIFSGALTTEMLVEI